MKKLTSAQIKLLLEARSRGSVAIGGFGTAHHHRPARALEDMGLLKFRLVPVPSDSFTLRFLGVPRGARLVGFHCQGWTLTPSGRRFAAILAERTQ
jgi:hypothetical protein